MSQINKNNTGGGGGAVTEVLGQTAYATNTPIMTVNPNTGIVVVENRSWPTAYVVDPSSTQGNRGTYTTINAAMADVVSNGATFLHSPTIFIRTGTYTENIAVPANAYINFQAYTTAGYTAQNLPDVEVSGNWTFGSGSVTTLSNLFLTSSSGDTVTIGSGQTVNIINCQINTGGTNAVNISGIPTSVLVQNTIFSANFLANVTSSSALILLQNCALSSSATIENSSTVEMENCTINSSFAVSGSANASLYDCGFFTTATESIVNSGSGTVTVVDSDLKSGGSSIFSGTGNFILGANTLSGTGNFYSAAIRSQIAQIPNQAGNVIKSRILSASATIASTDYYVGVSGNSGAVGITLPANTSLVVDQVFIFKDEAGTGATRNITITPTSGNIDGVSSLVINTNYGSYAIKFDGTNFFTFNSAKTIANPLPLSQGGTGQSLTAPPETGSFEFFNGTAVAASSSNRYRFYDDMSSLSEFDIHNAGTGATGTLASPIDSAHAGLIEMQTGTTNTGDVSVSVGNGSFPCVVLGGGNLYFETVVNIQTLATAGVEDYTLYFGLHDGWIFTNPPNNGFYFTYLVDTSVNWIINSANGGTRTSTTTTTAVATGWTRLGISYNLGTTTATFFINGTSVGTIATNISTNPIGPTWTVFKTAGTTNRLFYIDYVDLFVNFTTPR